MRRWAIRALVAVLALAGSAAAPSTSHAQTSAPDSVRVYLFTAGQGDEVWERFGHNAIGISGPEAAGDLLYNWGLFDFASPGFLGRFVRGDMVYWMGASTAYNDIQIYEARNRDIVVQELNLTRRQRDSLITFLNWNARPENKYYHYDYFRDNCSTRVRDALDRVLAGALRRATDSIVTPLTYRDHALRLMAGEPLLATGIDIGLGRPTDRRITAWEEMFIPMRLRDRIRDLNVPDDSGHMVPLVRSERSLFKAQRPPEATTSPHHDVLFLVMGLVIGAAMLVPTLPSARRRPRAVMLAIPLLWCAGAGVLGCLLAFLWLGTRHVYAYHNWNLLQYNPLWLIVAVLLPFNKRPGVARACVAFAAIGATLTILALVIALIPSLRQDSLDVLLLAAPVNLAAAALIRRLATPTPRQAVVA